MIINLGDAWPFPAVDDARRRGERTWFQVSQARYDYFIEVLPPIYFPGGFFVSEAASHDDRGVPIYSAFVEIAGRYYCREFARDRHAEAMQDLFESLGARKAGAS